MNVDDIMSRAVVSCRRTDTLEAAAEKMWQKDCGVLPVVDDDGKVVGVVTDRDICMAAYTQGKRLRDLPVAVAMAKHVHTCRPNDTLEAAERTMSENRIRRVPVVDDDGHPVGLLSLNDIARHASAARVRDGVDLTRTLAAICEPRAKPQPAPPGRSVAAGIG